jgi:hypothetical protein
MTGRGTDDHAVRGSKQAKAILESMGTYSDDEISTVASAVLHHSDKGTVQGPYDELLKDADVLDHCLYSFGSPPVEWETVRFDRLCGEFGLVAVK